MARVVFSLLILLIGACALAYAEEIEEVVPEAVEDVPEQQEVEQNDEIEKRGVGSIPYDSLGCYKDDLWRVLKKYHGDFNNPSTAIQECAKKAKFAGHNIFAIGYGKQCFSDGKASVNNARKTYARLGHGSGCKGGRGGFWRLNVYKLRTSNSVSYARLGCYKDDLWRVIKGHHEVMDSGNVVGQCARKAQLAGNVIFGVEAGKWCFTDGMANEAHKQKTYARLGKSTGCSNGKGGPWKITVYKVVGTDAAYNKLGCYKDDLWRVIKGHSVTFNPETAVQQCANKALAHGNTIFGVENNNACFTDGIAKLSNAGKTYGRLGKTGGCENGRGHGWKMSVYSASEGQPPAETKVSEYEYVEQYVWVPADEPAAVEDESVEEPEPEEPVADEAQSETAEEPAAMEDEQAEEPAAVEDEEDEKPAAVEDEQVEESVADEEAAVEDEEEEAEEPIANKDEEEQA